MGMEQEQRGGLNQKLDKLIEVLEPKGKKSKTPNLPKIKKTKLIQNYALVLYMMDNHVADFEWIKIENDYIYIRRTNSYHLATAGYVMNLKLKNKTVPLIIQPAWSLEPLTEATFDPVKHYEKTIAANKGANPQKVLITLMEQANLKIKGKMGGKTILWVVIGVIVVLYLLKRYHSKMTINLNRKVYKYSFTN